MYHSQGNRFKTSKHQKDFAASGDELNLRVLEVDRRFLESALREQTASRQHGGWIGKCPYCAATDKTKKKQAYLTPRKTGYVFHCCSCGVSQTVFNFLTATQGESRAQEYAQTRWEAGELCGGGWNCPLPQKVRERLLREKEERREAYRHAEHERKALNYQKKYGSSTH
jgi:hypothetical protein